MKRYYSCSVRWKIDGKTGPAWYTESWLIEGTGLTDVEARANEIAAEDALPEFEVLSGSISNIRRIVEVPEVNVD